MDFEECIQFANENPVCYVATVDGDKPHVRTFLMWFADERGFYFETLSPKEVSEQIKTNPNVEICFYSHGADLVEAKQMRVAGKAEMVDDPVLVEKIREERAFLSDLAGQNVGPYMEVFRIHEGDVHFWEMTDVMKEDKLEHLHFGAPELVG